MKKKVAVILIFLIFLFSCGKTIISSTPLTTISVIENLTDYHSIGVGGGGAMSGISISPYSNLMFVGTDMGTLFKSTDFGNSWTPVNHYQARFDSDLTRAVSVGFAADGVTLFFARAGKTPTRSSDAGNTFSNIKIDLADGEYIKYWHCDSKNSNIIFAATTLGIFKSTDKGLTWKRIADFAEEAIGTFIDQNSLTNRIYHATKAKVYFSDDGGKKFSTYYIPETAIRQFAGGSDGDGVTLALGDSNGPIACSWAYAYLNEWGQASIDKTIANCGFAWINKNNTEFVKKNQIIGDHLKMAENDSSTIYTTGGKNWIRQYGTKVFVSHDIGESWTLKLNQIDYDVIPYAPWPTSKIEYSAIALDIGWFDSGYESFEINQRNSNVVAGTGLFFLHLSMNGGDTWTAPFTKFNGTGTPTKGQTWKSTGLEVTTVYKTKFHPNNPSLLYAAMADLSGAVSEDHGRSFRITQPGYNSIYDYAFDSNNDLVVFAATGADHDYPNDWHANVLKGEGAIYKSFNRGKTWIRLTPNDTIFNRQYLSIAYDSKNNILYSGTQEVGIISSRDLGQTWNFINFGLPEGNKIIPQIEIDPKTGNVYALLTGDAPFFTNHANTGIYFLDIQNKAKSWVLLRKNINSPILTDQAWYYPTSFAIDFNSKESTNTLYLTDYENNGNWLMSGVWKSTDHGETWNRLKQVTHPTEIKIDSNNPNKIYVASTYDLSGEWGDGGELFSKDGGNTWQRNNLPPLQTNARGITLDPSNTYNIIYSYSGGGMMYGPNPNF